MPPDPDDEDPNDELHVEALRLARLAFWLLLTLLICGTAIAVGTLIRSAVGECPPCAESHR